MVLYVVPFVQRICSSCAFPRSEWKNMLIVTTESGQARTFVRIRCDYGKVFVYVNYGFSGLVRYKALKVQLLVQSNYGSRSQFSTEEHKVTHCASSLVVRYGSTRGRQPVNRRLDRSPLDPWTISSCALLERFAVIVLVLETSHGWNKAGRSALIKSPVAGRQPLNGTVSLIWIGSFDRQGGMSVNHISG